MPIRKARLLRAESSELGSVEVVRDREGVKLLVSGALYAVRSVRPERTPTPWLLLAAAPFLVSEVQNGGTPRIAILGYGGGTMARLILAAIPGAEITGLEPDAAVRRAARSELGRDVRGIRLVADRAESWLERTGESFHAILDDVYAPEGGRLGRPEAGVRLPALARRRLVAGGVYAANLISPATLRERRTMETLARSFRHGASAATREFAHRVVCGSDRPIRRGDVAMALNRLLRSPSSSRRDPPGTRFAQSAAGVTSVRLFSFSGRSRG